MSFDLRQNLLMVPSTTSGLPVYNFYNTDGLEFTLSGRRLKEICDCHFEGRLSHMQTVWGYSNTVTFETFTLADSGSLMLHVSLNQTCNCLVPIESITGIDLFRTINGILINDRMRDLITVHEKAKGRSLDAPVCFNDLSEDLKREMLLAFAVGPLRIKRANKDGLNTIHTKWLRNHDEEFEYIHKQLGLNPNEKLPADVYKDTDVYLSNRHLAMNKTVQMMANELAHMIEVFGLDSLTVPRDFNYANPNWIDGLCLIAQTYIYDADAKTRLANKLKNPQFVINFIYALAKDMNWDRINSETFEYQQSLVRRLIQELRNEIEREGSDYVFRGDIVYHKTVHANED